MRVVATEYLSLDGVFEEPGRWSGPFFDDQAQQFKSAELYGSDALLLGRKTYEGFAAAWPSMTDETGFAYKMNTMPKYVVSSTLQQLEWSGSRLISYRDVQLRHRHPRVRARRSAVGLRQVRVRRASCAGRARA